MDNGVPYSQSIEFGSLIYTSGQLPVNLETNIMNTLSFKEKVETILNNIGIILEKGSSSLENVISFKVYLTDLNNLETVNIVFKEKLNKPYPVRTAIEVSRLPIDSPIEIEAIAYKN